jgi:hypothetical protein
MTEVLIGIGLVLLGAILGISLFVYIANRSNFWNR